MIDQAQKLAPPESIDFPITSERTVSINVTPISNENALVRVTRVDLKGDYLKIEIENGTRRPVIAIALDYQFHGCFPGEASISGGDGRRVPGMYSVNIPAHGRVWYLDDHMASRLALAAIMQKSRYIRARPVIFAAVFANGNEIRFQATRHGNSNGSMPDGVCETWSWNDALNRVHGFQLPTSTTVRNQLDAHSAGAHYTCSVSFDLLHCPD
jgi:hypothetical protein